MADNTTTTTPQSNGVPLSGLPALTAPVNGEELLLITKNNQSMKTTAAALKTYINAEMATLTGMQQAVKAVSDRLDALVNGNASSAIDTFNEIEAFLAGITDTETLTGLLADLKSVITAETDNKLSGKVDKVTGKGLSANDYTDDDKAKLTALPTSTQLTEKIDEAKLALFVDQFNVAAGVYGKYDPANAPDPQHPFYLNTLWLTYREAIKSLEAFTRWGTSPMDSYCTDIKTNIPSITGSTRVYQNSFNRIEVVNLDKIDADGLISSLNGSNLKKVLNFKANYIERANNVFNAPALTDLQISGLKISLDLSKCPLINLTSWQGLVSNAANTTKITITVHPEVYAKLTDESNAEWHTVLTDAEAKQITFATTK